MGRDTEIMEAHSALVERREDPADEHLRAAHAEYIHSVKAPGKKLDAGKAPLFQGVLSYFPRALKAVAGVSAYGLAKYKLEYADKNWMRVENGYGRYSDALVRHTTESAFGKFDDESGLLHDAQAAWNALARLELLMLSLEDQQKIANQKKGLEI